MKTIRINTTSTFKIPKINLAIGNFDGVHIGHQKIIKNLIELSKRSNIQSAILCFFPHPRQFFSKNIDDFNIFDEDTKINFVKKLGVDYYISFHFDSLLAYLLLNFRV